MKRSFLSLFAVLAVIGSATAASASVHFELGTRFNNSGPITGPSGPGSGTSWVDIDIYDSADTTPYSLSSSDVLVVMSGHLGVNTAIRKVGLNLGPNNGSLNAQQMQIAFSDSVGHSVSPVANNQLDRSTYVGGGFEIGASVDNSSVYDLVFNFTGNKSFDGSDVAVFILHYTGGSLSATDFLNTNTYINNNPIGFYYAAAQVDKLDSNSSVGASGYVADIDGDGPGGGDIPYVPEPASLAIWSLGLGIAGLVRLRRTK